MDIPKDLPVSESRIFWLWMEEGSGILYLKYKAGVKVDRQSLEESLAIIRELTGGEKACILADITNRTETNRDAREYAAAVSAQSVKAMALIAGTALGRYIAQLYITMNRPPQPVKWFRDEEKAREWLKQFV